MNFKRGFGVFSTKTEISRITVAKLLKRNTFLAALAVYAVLSFAITTAVFAGNAALPSGGGGSIRLNRPIVGMAATPSGSGYWLVASDGGIFSFGDAQFYGSTGSMRLNQPIVGMAATPSGNGYWLVASDGGIFSFGNAAFYGSTGSIRLNQPIVGMSALPSGGGYWLVASDGGIFSFGATQFYGSTGSMRLNQPIVGMAATPSGNGYWLVASDGGIFSFGDAQFYGSTGGGCLGSPIVGMASNPYMTGYFTATQNGQARAFSPTYTASCSGVTSSGETSAESAIAQDMFSRVNAERAARGLPALSWSSSLSGNARNWSLSMGRTGNFTHSNLYPLLQQFNTAAENIGVGGAGTRSGAIHVAWMNSTGHRVNILAPNLDTMGIGVYCSPDGKMWATQQFGRYPNSSRPSGFGPTPSVSPIVRSDTGGPSC